MSQTLQGCLLQRCPQVHEEALQLFCRQRNGGWQLQNVQLGQVAGHNPSPASSSASGLTSHVLCAPSCCRAAVPIGYQLGCNCRKMRNGGFFSSQSHCAHVVGVYMEESRPLKCTFSGLGAETVFVCEILTGLGTFLQSITRRGCGQNCWLWRLKQGFAKSVLAKVNR